MTHDDARARLVAHLAELEALYEKTREHLAVQAQIFPEQLFDANGRPVLGDVLIALVQGYSVLAQPSSDVWGPATPTVHYLETGLPASAVNQR